MSVFGKQFHIISDLVGGVIGYETSLFKLLQKKEIITRFKQRPLKKSLLSTLSGISARIIVCGRINSRFIPNFVVNVSVCYIDIVNCLFFRIVSNMYFRSY